MPEPVFRREEIVDGGFDPRAPVYGVYVRGERVGQVWRDDQVKHVRVGQVRYGTYRAVVTRAWTWTGASRSAFSHSDTRAEAAIELIQLVSCAAVPASTGEQQS